MKNIQSINTTLAPGYSLQKRKPAAANISMTGPGHAASDKKNMKKNITICTAVLALVAFAIGIARFISKDHGKSILKLIRSIVNENPVSKAVHKTGNKKPVSKSVHKTDNGKSMFELIRSADNVQIGRGKNALRIKNGEIVERVVKPRTTKAGQKALDAQAAVNESLKGYAYTRPASAGWQRPGADKQVRKFMDRYCRTN